jgi:hypothetical protein
MYTSGMNAIQSIVRPITACRVCSSQDLAVILELGNQPLSGVFPSTDQAEPLEGPLTILKCNKCSLVQLAHDYPLDLLYGENYGYRSGLNASMSSHLQLKARKLNKLVGMEPREIVLDIGSNDGTFLNAWGSEITRIGFDPTISKFGEFYDSTIIKVPDFFSPELYLSSFKPAKLITSISMFYDLQDPLAFVEGIKKCLAADGLWHFEQSYLYSMIQSTSYDTICHEHLEYYSLQAVTNLLEICGLKVVDVELNSVNGGSFSVTATHRENHFVPSPLVEWLSRYEKSLDALAPLATFASRVKSHKEQFLDLLGSLKQSGATVWGLGASTKGNVLLNYCGIDSALIQKIADVNPYKSGRFTPGSRIEIVPETEFLANRPDFAVVLPWHFRNHLSQRHVNYLAEGGKLIFPFPSIEVVSD